MDIFIRSASSISPQKTFGRSSLSDELILHEGTRMKCLEPEYKEFIDPKLIRRMSRIIKMGVAAATACLKEANVEMPDAIVAGTAYGCLEDTGVFITKMVEQKEELLTPTSFIQSTHNTVAAQIALMLHCHHYNNTFVHRGFSFESALLDAIMLLNENAASTVLAGGVDEITDISQKILTRFGLYKREQTTNNDLLTSNSKGTIAGEGTTFFLLSNQQSENDYAQLDAIKTFYKPASNQEIEKEIYSFLNEQCISINDIDLIITGRNGDKSDDEVYTRLEKSVFSNKALANYKHLCGEYPTATAFALWLACNIIQAQHLPPHTVKMQASTRGGYKNVLVYNNHKGVQHSFMLV